MPKYIDNTAERLTSVKRASRDATLFRGFWQDDIAPLTTYDLVLDIPAGGRPIRVYQDHISQNNDNTHDVFHGNKFRFC